VVADVKFFSASFSGMAQVFFKGKILEEWRLASQLETIRLCCGMFGTLVGMHLQVGLQKDPVHQDQECR
jgi:hypothetical protein